MNRRTFLPWFAGGISGSFLLGTMGGIGAGAAGMAAIRPRSKPSHAQQGEDLIVESICEFLAIDAPSYLDIGAADPIQNNNTYLFYSKGCRGVLVEPNPAFCRGLRAKRPGDRVLNVGVGVTGETEADYYIIGGKDGDYLNTFSKDQVESYRARSGGQRPVEKVVKMPLVDVNRIIEEH